MYNKYIPAFILIAGGAAVEIAASMKLTNSSFENPNPALIGIIRVAPIILMGWGIIDIFRALRETADEIESTEETVSFQAMSWQDREHYREQQRGRFQGYGTFSQV